MAETYDIRYQNERVGSARLERQGLYLCFFCRCRLPDDGMYRIHAVAGDKREDLGICIPVEGKFGMDKKIPAKRLGEGELSFQLVPKDWKPEKFVAKPEPEPPVQEEISAEPVLPAPEPQPKEPPVENSENQFLPVSEEEPFEYLDQLEHAHMEVHGDQPGIVLDEEMDE